jgi:beta-mannosidase
MEERPEEIRITVATDRFARFVKLECGIDHTMFSDNYFNLAPGEKKTIVATNRKGTSVAPSDISVSALNGSKAR